jgi:hypothetical protein
MKNVVDPDLIWRELQHNLAAFTEKTVFDGGFAVEPVIMSGWTIEHFRHGWIPRFPHTLKGVRNALAHGREQRQMSVILPTTSNFQRLQPWIAPLAVAAREVMVYQRIA